MVSLTHGRRSSCCGCCQVKRILRLLLQLNLKNLKAAITFGKHVDWILMNKASLNLYVRMVLPVQAGLGKNAWTGVLVAASKLQRGPEP